MEIWNSLFFALAASVLTYVVTRRRARNEGEIYRDPEIGKLIRQMHGDIMYPGDMTESVERSQFRAQTHELVQISDIGKPAELQIFFCISVGCYFFRLEQYHVYGRIKGKRLLLIAVQSL